MNFEKEGQTYQIPLTGLKISLNATCNLIGFETQDQTLSVTSRNTQIEFYFKIPQEEHEAYKWTSAFEEIINELIPHSMNKLAKIYQIHEIRASFFDRDLCPISDMNSSENSFYKKTPEMTTSNDSQKSQIQTFENQSENKEIACTHSGFMHVLDRKSFLKCQGCRN